MSNDTIAQRKARGYERLKNERDAAINRAEIAEAARDDAIKANEKLASEILSLTSRKFSDRNNAALLSRAESAEARAAQLEAENQRIMLEADRQIKFYQNLIHTIQQERDEARAKLEQAQRAERERCAKIARGIWYLEDIEGVVHENIKANPIADMIMMDDTP